MADSNAIVENLPLHDVFIPVEVQPEMIKYITPIYPRIAKQKRYQGVVWVKALIDSKGLVIRARVGKSSGQKSLDKAAVEASFGNRFKPAILNSRPIACWVTYKVDFSLR